MKIEINSIELQKHLRRCKNVIHSKSLIPILECFYIKLEETGMEIKGTTGEITIISKLEGISSSERAILLVKADLFEKLIKEIPPQVVTIEIDTKNKQIIVKTYNGQYTMATYPPEDYPELPTPDFKESITIERDVLKKAIEQSVFAIGKKDIATTFSVNGVLMECKDNEIAFVGTDLRILSLWKVFNVYTQPIQGKRIVIDGEACQKLLSILKDEESDKITMSFADNYIEFKTNEWKMISKLLPDSFPNYSTIIPEKVNYEITFNKKEFLNALNRVAIFSGIRGILSLSTQKNKIYLRSITLEESNKVEEIIEGTTSGEDIEVALDIENLSELIEHVTTDEATISITTPTSPIIITNVPKVSEDSEYCGIMAPSSKD